MFAIVTIAGKQFQVSKGDVLDVPKLDGEVGDTVVFDRVLLVSDEKSTTVGTPTIKSAKVTAKIAAHHQDEKINVRRFKSKVRYRKSIGFRAQLTNIEIVSIG